MDIKTWAKNQEADLTEINSTLQGISEGINKLDKRIAEFNNSPGTLSPEDQTALDSIQQMSKQLLSQAKAIQVNAEDGKVEGEEPKANKGEAAFKAANATPPNPTATQPTAKANAVSSTASK